MSHARLAAIGGAAVLCAALLAGCGSDGESASDVTVSQPGDAGTNTMSDMTGMTSEPAGSGSGSGSGSTTGADAASTITISNFSFSPPITVKPGATVTVVNKDSTMHDVDSDDGVSFNTAPKGKGTFTFTAPTTPGSYGYFCSIHPDMHGTLIVAP